MGSPAELKIEYVELSKLKPWEKNPRKNDTAAGRLADMIGAHGFLNPIIASPDGTIRAGHTRFKAAKKLGLASVPVVFVEFESEAKAHAFALADNKSAEWAEWDFAEMASILEEITAAGVAVAETGFTPEELEKLAGQVLPNAGQVDPDEVPGIPEEPRTKLGDVYQLGNHRLICGDATQLTTLETLMGHELADMVWTDPPYNVDYTGKTKDALKIQNDKMGDDQFRQFLTDVFTSLFTVSKAGAAIYVAHADSEGYNFRGAFIDGGWLLKQCLIWVKQSIVMGRQDYHWQHEPILYGWREGGPHKWFGDRKTSTVINIDRPSRSEIHPTMKPVALIELAMENSSAIGQVVLDTFGGSGSTMIACEHLGRKCRMVELDPKYCDVIVDRWEKFTGKKATLIGAEEKQDVSRKPNPRRRTKD